MKTAFVHIGTHKTGSTYLQAWLIANQQKLLRDHNLYLPTLGSMSEQYTVLGKLHASLALTLTDPSQADSPGKPFAFLRSEIAGLEHNILISSELLENRIHTKTQFDFLVKFLRDCGFRPHIIVYLREQADYLNSRYAQDVRRFHYGGDFASYAERAARVIWFNYERLFRNIVGRNDLDFSVRPFPVACKNGLETDLMQMLTGNPALTRNEIRAAGYQATENKNQACGPMTVLLSRMVQEELQRGFPGIQRHDMTHFLPWMLVTKLGDEYGWNDTKFIGMTPELAAKTRERFRQQNETFAQTVWGCPWSHLFPESNFISNELQPGDLGPEESEPMRAAINRVMELKASKERGKESKEKPAPVPPVRPSIVKRIIGYVKRRCFPKPVGEKKNKNPKLMLEMNKKPKQQKKRKRRRKLGVRPTDP